MRLDVEDFYLGTFTVIGISKNLSLTGVRVKVDRMIPAGSKCRVSFMDSVGRIRPLVIGATARNVTKEISEGKKFYQVGLQFEEPLEYMKRPGEL
jgi:hypothetical protein